MPNVRILEEQEEFELTKKLRTLCLETGDYVVKGQEENLNYCDLIHRNSMVHCPYLDKGRAYDHDHLFMYGCRKPKLTIYYGEDKK